MNTLHPAMTLLRILRREVPTAAGVSPGITLDVDGTLRIAVCVRDQWLHFTLTDEDLARPAEAIATEVVDKLTAHYPLLMLPVAIEVDKRAERMGVVARRGTLCSTTLMMLLNRDIKNREWLDYHESLIVEARSLGLPDVPEDPTGMPYESVVREYGTFDAIAERALQIIAERRVTE